MMDHRKLRAFELAHALLDANFPPSLHEDILAAVGLEPAYAFSRRRQRDLEFRQRALTAYEYRCAVCGYDVRLGGRELGPEGAHIKWHQAGGPDVEVVECHRGRETRWSN